MSDACVDCPEHLEMRAVDNSSWDGPAAMSRCVNSDSPASCLSAICAGKKSGDPATAAAHALPHHKSPGDPPNAAGVRNALARLSQTQGLTNASAARSHLEAHMKSIQSQSNSRPPRDNLVRAIRPGYELRDDGEGGMPTLLGHFAVFNEWTEIDSIFEGNFMERVAPGAFAKTFQENRSDLRVLFQHGRDPQIGDKPLGPITELREDAKGAYYEAPLLDTQYNRELLPGLKAGLYGASFRFRVLKEEFDKEPQKTASNPDGIPERTIKELALMEFGPVTFPAYAGATAGVRSLTDEFVFGQFQRDPRSRDLAEFGAGLTTHSEQTPTEPGPSPTPKREPITVRTKEESTVGDKDTLTAQYQTVSEMQGRLEEAQARVAEIDTEFADRSLSDEVEEEFTRLNAEISELEARLKVISERRARVAELAKAPTRTEPQADVKKADYSVYTDRSPKGEDIYDLEAIRSGSKSPDEFQNRMRDNAKRSVEAARFPEFVNREAAQEHVERMLDEIDAPDPAADKVGGELAGRILATGSEVYKRALGKYIKNGYETLSAEEQRALSIGTGSAGGFAVVYTLDPTIVPTSNFSVNPWRAVARIETISGTNEWKAVTSGAITAAYSAEAAESSDNAPTLAQPDIIVEKAQAFVPFSIEVGQDWGALQSSMAALLQDAKDDLEATKFTLGAGHGSTEPKGIITGATNTTTAGGSAAFAIADLYKLWEALPPRFRPRAEFFMNTFIIDKIRQFDTAGGSGVWIDGFGQGGGRGLVVGAGGMVVGSQNANVGPRLLGRSAYESTAMASALTTGQKILLVGDFRYFVIVDRVGMNIEVVPLLVGTNHRPTGQRGLYAYWRNSSDVLSAAAFQVLVTG